MVNGHHAKPVHRRIRARHPGRYHNALHQQITHLEQQAVDLRLQLAERGSAATLATQNRQARLMKELRAARARMQPWQDTQAVKALDERLAVAGCDA